MRWAIAEDCIPSRSVGPEPAITSHETACMLGASDREAHDEVPIVVQHARLDAGQAENALISTIAFPARGF